MTVRLRRNDPFTRDPFSSWSGRRDWVDDDDPLTETLMILDVVLADLLSVTTHFTAILSSGPEGGRNVAWPSGSRYLYVCR